MMTPDEQRFWDACCAATPALEPEYSFKDAKAEAEWCATIADAKLGERRKRTAGEPVADDLADLVHALVDERVRLRESHAFWLREITAAHKTEDWQPIETAPRDGRWFLAWLGAGYIKARRNHNGDLRDEFGNGTLDATHWRPMPEGLR